MRVAQINFGWRPGVDDSRAFLSSVPTLTGTCNALTRAGCDVIVLQRFGHDDDATEDGVRYVFRKDGTPHPYARPWTAVRSLLAQARTYQPDVLHVNGLIFPVQVAQARAMLGNSMRIVVQHHGELPASPRLRVLQRLCLRFADAFIFNGAGNAEPWRAAGIIRANHPVFEAVEGSCDFEMLPQDIARCITGSSGSPMVLWVGRLHLRKDPLTALEGFASSLAMLPDAQLYMIYGDDMLLPQVKARLAQQPELARRVHLVGKVAHEALPAWYSAADVFLTSSPAEGSNYALIESMSCGASPVCSDIPPHRFIVGEHGVYWPVGDPQACARACVQANQLVSSGNRRTIRRYFEKRLSFSAIGEQLLQAYHRCLILNNEKSKR